MPPTSCAECGATLADGRPCRDHFHDPLLLEWEIPGASASILHMYAVGTYALQHPSGMGDTAGALASLRDILAEALERCPSVAEVRRRLAAGAGRFQRRPGDPIPAGPGPPWPLTVADVCTAETFGEVDTFEGYGERVEAWARSTVDRLGPLFAAPGA